MVLPLVTEGNEIVGRFVALPANGPMSADGPVSLEEDDSDNDADRQGYDRPGRPWADHSQTLPSAPHRSIIRSGDSVPVGTENSRVSRAPQTNAMTRLPPSSRAEKSVPLRESQRGRYATHGSVVGHSRLP
jgi:hypothetical protein